MPEIFDPVAAVYKQVGEDKPFFTLVDKFYAGVENDLILRPLYPEDLTESKLHLALFLIQRTGGRTTYSDERGHPRMRARHLPFPIGTNEKNAWMNNMKKALAMVPEFEPHLGTLTEFFETFATFLINKPN
ncbi:MAG: globin [Candidatus Obscuribacterales bacterium]|nr:globin [Candidatus Obscuribacterales bacterium]